MKEKMLRTFIALDMDKRTRLALEEIITHLKNQPLADQISWISQDKLHMTLHFLGDMPEKKIIELQQVLTDALCDIKPFILIFDQILHFPPNKHPHVIALSFLLTDELTELFAVLEKTIQENVESVTKRPFLPHLTLGRLRNQIRMNLSDPQLMKLVAEKFSRPMLINEIIFYQSQQTSTGYIYTPLKRYKLSPLY